jgi:coproporphyrinogen III oxidase
MINAVRSYLLSLQQDICQQLEEVDGKENSLSMNGKRKAIQEVESLEFSIMAKYLNRVVLTSQKYLVKVCQNLQLRLDQNLREEVFMRWVCP